MAQKKSEKILLEFADSMLEKSSWYILEEDGSMPENLTHLACLGWHDAEKMALTAYACDAEYVVYLGYEDRGFLGEGNIFSQCLRVISCRVDTVLFPSEESYSSWCEEHGVKASDSFERSIKIYLGYAQLVSHKVSAQILLRKRETISDIKIDGSSSKQE